MESLIHQLRQVASKSRVNYKLGAGLFYSKKGFVRMGCNTHRSYVSRQLFPCTHAEQNVIHQVKTRFSSETLKKLKLMVIRIGLNQKLLPSRPCVTCTERIYQSGIRTVYYINDDYKLVHERTSSLYAFRSKEPGINISNMWFDSVSGTRNAASSFVKEAKNDNRTKFTKEMGEHLSYLRIKKGWTIEEFALRMSLSPVVIKRIESGTYSYNIDIVNQLRRVIGFFTWP